MGLKLQRDEIKPTNPTIASLPDGALFLYRAAVYIKTDEAGDDGDGVMVCRLSDGYVMRLDEGDIQDTVVVIPKGSTFEVT